MGAKLTATGASSTPGTTSLVRLGDGHPFGRHRHDQPAGQRPGSESLDLRGLDQRRLDVAVLRQPGAGCDDGRARLVHLLPLHHLGHPGCQPQQECEPQMNQVREYRNPLLIAGGALVVAIILWLALISPQNSKLSSLQSQSTTLQAPGGRPPGQADGARVRRPEAVDQLCRPRPDQHPDPLGAEPDRRGRRGVELREPVQQPGRHLRRGPCAVQRIHSGRGHRHRWSRGPDGRDDGRHRRPGRRHRGAHDADRPGELRTDHGVRQRTGHLPPTVRDPEVRPERTDRRRRPAPASAASTAHRLTSSSASGTVGTPLWVGGTPTAASAGPYNLQITGSIYYTSTPNALAACTKATAAQAATK